MLKRSMIWNELKKEEKIKMSKFDFSGWATKNDLLCGDGRTIRKNAFKDCDGTTVPLVWNHQHNGPDNVLGHALLENRDDGVYAYCTFNESESGLAAKELVKHGDVKSLSIYANKLKQVGGDVIHGTIRELSLVLAGANPGAKIDFIMAHSDDEEYADGVIAEYDENIMLYHSDDGDPKKEGNKVEKEEKQKEEKQKEEGGEKTVEEVIETMNEEQKKLLYGLVGIAREKASSDEDDDDKEDEEDMKHNVFDKDDREANVLCHADEEQILSMAKTPGIGTFREALNVFAEQNELQHGAIDGEVLGTLFPEYKDVYPGEPETLTDDQTWIDSVIAGVHKSPISRVRTRQLDARNRRNRAKGYKKGTFKTEGTNVALLSRTTDPQTIFIKDKMNRDDIIDFTDFDLVNYQWKIMRQALNEEIATAILVGDGRDEGDEDKIYESHVRSIWNDDELYTIHQDVDIEAAKTKLQGTDTATSFGDNYVYAEAIIEAALYSREKYKGSGSLKFYCTPHLLNVMLLARDMNGRRIYSSKADLQAALNVTAIETVEQFEGLVRTDTKTKKHELLGIFVNLTDYQVGSTKGGEITKFDQFDIDFNQQKYLIETRISGALTRVQSAIVLEKPVD